MPQNKDVAVVLQLAEKAGWTCVHRKTHQRHMKWLSPDKKTIVTLPSTPHGGNHTIQNIKSQFRRGGLDVPH
jgi:hypothetical protein